MGCPCAFESVWHVFVCVAVISTSTGTTGGCNYTTLIFNHVLTVSLWNTEEAQNNECKTDYLYKLLTVFRVVSKITCGMFWTVGKVTNTVRITGHAIQCQRAPNCDHNVLSVCISFPTWWLHQFWHQIVVTWTEVGGRGRIYLPPSPHCQNLFLTVSAEWAVALPYRMMAF